jgi:cardiolipin synthase A/B
MGMEGTAGSVFRTFSDQAFSRAAGAVLVPGNRVRLLNDAAENYPAWLEAIQSAREWIHFETYIIHEDEAGHRFADLLCAKAQEGVHVRLIYDWVGSLGHASRAFWHSMVQRGVDVRCFNPPRLDSPFGWLNRDHRKTLSVDGRIAFVSGLCVGERWLGYPDQRIDAWRDMGLQVEGPAIADLERAFAEVWAVTGQPLPAAETKARLSTPPGDVNLRVVGTVPNSASIYRFDQLIAAVAEKSIWIWDAYFIGTSSYVQALNAAARSGVDVRLLVPGASDVPVMRALSRAGMRPLLEAGVRVFEWNGAMMHAKTAVVDGRWARVGSTNLNLTSWIGNWEMDVIIEDTCLAQQLEKIYANDLSRCTEIVLGTRGRRPVETIGRPDVAKPRPQSGSGGRTAVGVMRLSHVVGAAVTNRRALGPAETVIMRWAAAILLIVAAVAAFVPEAVALPVVILCAWIAASLLFRAYKLQRAGSRVRRQRKKAA